MRTNLVRVLVPLALIAAACGRGASDTSRLTDDLKKDLEASSSSKLELANAAGDYKPTRFVSDIEQANASAPVQRAPMPRRAPAKSANLKQDESQSPSAEATPEVQVAQVSTEAPQPAPESDVPRVPTVAPRPSALPVDMPSPQGSSGGYGRGNDGIGMGRGDGRGSDIGGIIGVVIRGGGVGDDHCVPRRRGGGRGMPFPINR